ncbi:hypothetical protein PLICRDRAFT_39440 [Plicaturopsis crispa FD-325 SS-3]|nr:hypothetical protein PLICRDRAFT_39440 [Plicaturopsis crispa FD-325 SS-3]
MASAFSRRVLPALRSLRTASRRSLSTAAPHPAPSVGSDTPWIVGSAVVFGPIGAYVWYLKAGGGGSHGHDGGHGHDSGHAHAESHAESHTQAATPVADDEGTEAPVAEVQASVDDAASDDSPKNADAAESDSDTTTKFDSGAPGQDEEAEKGPVEQKEHPGEKKTGTFQSSSDSGPTDLGDARAAAVNDKQPKNVHNEASA